MTRRTLFGLLGATLPLSIAFAQRLEERERSVARRIADASAEGRISPRDARMLERELERVSRRIDHERRDRGRLTPREREELARDLDRVEEHLREVERPRRQERRRY